MNKKIFLLSFGLPAFLGLLIIICLFLGLTSFELIVLVFLFFTQILISLLRNKKYLQHITIEDDNIRFEYLSYALKQKSLSVPRKCIQEIILVKNHQNLLFPFIFKLVEKDKSMNFFILQKSIYENVRNAILASGFTPVTP